MGITARADGWHRIYTGGSMAGHAQMTFQSTVRHIPSVSHIYAGRRNILGCRRCAAVCLHGSQRRQRQICWKTPNFPGHALRQSCPFQHIENSCSAEKFRYLSREALQYQDRSDSEVWPREIPGEPGTGRPWQRSRSYINYRIVNALFDVLMIREKTQNGFGCVWCLL